VSRATRDRSDEWRRLVSSLRTHVRAGDRAVHKPLLTLLVIAAAERGDPNSFRFADVEGPLAQLLREFGRPTKSVHPEYPFWHLGSDGYWKVANGEALPLRKAGSHPTPGTLRAHDATAHVPESLWTTLVQRPDVRDELAATLLDSFWPGTLHADIRAAVGLPEGVRTDTRRRPRDRPSASTCCAPTSVAARSAAGTAGSLARTSRWTPPTFTGTPRAGPTSSRTASPRAPSTTRCSTAARSA